MRTRSRKLKRMEDISQLKKHPFALHCYYSFKIVILVISKKLSRLVFFRSAYYAHCTFRRREGKGTCYQNFLSLLRFGI